MFSTFGEYKTLMAVLHRKEEKIEVVLSKLPKDYTDKQFVDLFIQLYSKDWGKIKANYLKQSQDKEPGTVITMPKPELYLKSILTTYLENNDRK
jgi:chloramphenicol O-acetyltransferase